MTYLQSTKIAKENLSLVKDFSDYLKSPLLNKDYVEPIYSSSTNYVQKKIIIEYQNGKAIVLYSQNSSKSCVDLSWVIDIDGLKYNIPDIALWSHYHKGLNLKLYPLRERELVEELFRGYVFSNKK